MSANLSVKDISENTKNSADIESILVEKYESLYFRLYLKAFIFRIFFFISIIILISPLIYFYKNPTSWSVIEPYATIFSLIMGAFSALAVFVGKFPSHTIIHEQINELEDEIVKKKLTERFGTDNPSKRKTENFYIELNGLTKAKYETAFKFYTYEFYIYTVVSLIIAVIFTLRIL